ncbi:FAD-dependent oxidoreductase [Streptomyces sp. NPDC058695]|uniref:FAD-dependent oxidoreductase n=1 Tax=Streptomyces sp. NPDC058695 TaxID=3346604 RepID=UPI003656CBAB
MPRCVGVRPDPLAEALGLPVERGWLLVDPHLQVPDHPEVFACGDAAAVPDLGRPGQYTPMTAQHAGRHGKIAGRKAGPHCRGCVDERGNGLGTGAGSPGQGRRGGLPGPCRLRVPGKRCLPPMLSGTDENPLPAVLGRVRQKPRSPGHFPGRTANPGTGETPKSHEESLSAREPGGLV